jgi:ATP-binding cassette subfamily C protein
VSFDKLIQKLKEIPVRGNQPLQLDRENKIWIVKKGKVDIFAVQLKDGKPVGQKFHVLRLEQGEVFFGVECDGIVLQALGTPETVCCELEIEMAEEQNIINWLVKISKNLTKSLRPKVTDEIGIVKELKLEKNKSFSSKQDVLWIKVISGKIKFLDRLVIETPFFPLTKNSWITTIEDSVITTFSTNDLFKSDNFFENFHNFNKLVINIIKENIEFEKNNELERLRSKSENKTRVLISSIEKIKSVLLSRKLKISIDEATDNPLLAACKIVGTYLKIKIVPHPTDNSTIENITRASKIKSRKVILKDDWWNYDSGPLLCFLKEEKHPVAVLPLSPRSYELIDIMKNKRIKVDSKVAEELEPFAYTFYRPFPEKELSGWELFKFGIFNCGLDITMIFLMGIAGALLGLLTPIFTGIIFDTVIPEAATSQLFQMAFILISCAIATLLFEITKATAILRLEGRADYSLQAAIWDRLVSLPVPFFRKYSSGDLAMRSMGIDAIRQILSGVTVQSILSFIFSIFYWGLLFYYNFSLAVIASILGLIMIITTISIGYLCVKNQQKMNDIKNKLSGVILQFLTGVPKLRITGTEINAFSIWAKGFSEKKEVAKNLGLTQNTLRTFTSMFPVLASICIFSWVAFKVNNNALTTGDFLAFNSAYSSFQNGLLQMSMALVTSLNIIPLFRNLKPIITTLPEVSEAKEHPGELTGKIEVNHINFRYTEDGPLILKDVSLKINPDEFVAIVGGSGSGKSTLFRLLLGFEIPESGTIFYDGKDLDTLDIVEVRKQLGVVLQNAKLLQGSIFENIVGSSNLTIDDAWEAARMAGCDEDIRNMPMKMHTVVPPGGGNLSGGQRQRIIIARALVKRPRIIFFDEATSALDNKTQAIVSESLESMKVTRVVIAHRLSTIRNADMIYCLDRGVIVESGTYDELIENKGFFYELAKRQIA